MSLSSIERRVFQRHDPHATTWGLGPRTKGMEYSFRVYFENKFFWVHIFRSRKIMTGYRKTHHGEITIRTAQVFCRSPFMHNEGMGEIVFCHPYIHDAMVVHEMFHAVCYWAEKSRLSLGKSFRPYNITLQNERVALVLDHAVSQFWKQFCKKYPRNKCFGFGWMEPKSKKKIA
jgi:hypothetical protein